MRLSRVTGLAVGDVRSDRDRENGASGTVREGVLEAHGRKYAGKLVACLQLAASPSIS